MKFEQGFWADLLRPICHYIEGSNNGLKVRR